MISHPHRHNASRQSPYLTPSNIFGSSGRLAEVSNLTIMVAARRTQAGIGKDTVSLALLAVYAPCGPSVHFPRASPEGPGGCRADPSTAKGPTASSAQEKAEN